MSKFLYFFSSRIIGVLVFGGLAILALISPKYAAERVIDGVTILKNERD